MRRAVFTLAGLLVIAGAQKCTNKDTKLAANLLSCTTTLEGVLAAFQNPSGPFPGLGIADPNGKMCQELLTYHTCFCHQAATCGDNTAGTAAIEKQLSESLRQTPDSPCSSEGRNSLELGSPAFCKPILSTVCSESCGGSLFGDGVSPACATALDKQFVDADSLQQPEDNSLQNALKGLQGLTRQTRFVVNDKEIEGGGIFVPECSAPTDFFACAAKSDGADKDVPTPAPAPDEGIADKLIFCKDDDQLTNGDQTKYKDKAARIDPTCPATVLGSTFDPIAQQFGGALPKVNVGQNDRKLGRCCDRPLKPGRCNVQNVQTQEKNVKHTRCLKRWVGSSIQRFKKACESAGDGRAKYGTAYFLSARAEKTVGTIKNIYEIIDGNALCWPNECAANDLQGHLQSRSKECTLNFMDECSYSARPMECNEGTALVGGANTDCSGPLTESIDGGFKDTVNKWNKQQFGYSLCDKIMDKTLEGEFSELCTPAGTTTVVRGVANDAARAAPSMFSLVAALVVLTRNAL